MNSKEFWKLFIKEIKEGWPIFFLCYIAGTITANIIIYFLK